MEEVKLPAADASAPGDQVVRDAVRTIYVEGFKAGHARGYSEGLAAAREALAGISSKVAAIDPSALMQERGASVPLETPLDMLELNIRTYNVLRREGIHTIGDLVSRSEEDLYDYRNLGPAGAREIKERLAKFGYTLKSE